MSRTVYEDHKVVTTYTYGALELGVVVYSNGFTFTLNGVPSSVIETRRALASVMPAEFADTIPGIIVALHYEVSKQAKAQAWSETYKLAINAAQQAYANSLN